MWRWPTFLARDSSRFSSGVVTSGVPLLTEDLSRLGRLLNKFEKLLIPLPDFLEKSSVRGVAVLVAA